MEPDRDSTKTLQDEEPTFQHKVQCARCDPISLAFLQKQIKTLQEVVDQLSKDDRSAETLREEPKEGREPKDGRSKNASRSRIKYVVSKVDKGTGSRGETPGQPPGGSENRSTDTEFAFEAKEVFNEEHKSTSQVTLLAPSLRDLVYSVLRKQFEHEKKTNWAKGDPSLSTMKEPFTLLAIYWKELVEESERVEDDPAKTQARADLQLLLQHVRALKPDLTLLCESIDSIKRIRFEYLFILFRPGTFVIATQYLNQPQLFKIHSQSTDKEQFVLKCWAYDWNGVELIRSYYNFTINCFDDEVDIKELPCCPASHYEDKHPESGIPAWESKLISRGHKFSMVCARRPGAASMCHYRGRILKVEKDIDYFLAYIELKLGMEDPVKQQEITIDEDIMVDFESYKQDNGSLPISNLLPLQDFNSCQCSLCLDKGDSNWAKQFPQIIPETENAISRIKNKPHNGDESDKNVLLLPPRVLGWAFKTGVFAQFLVDSVEEIENTGADQEFNDRLFFPKDLEENKMDIKSLIMAHTSEENKTSKDSKPILSDPVGGKGEGLIILLHGPPGVGKTLSAELVASAARRPLYKVGASDIGFEPDAAERKLKRLFQLASKWQAVLLIDEADVFLDSRGTKGEVDVKKNALVSVMLRVLEYFRGVLIMTTNRVLTLDAAMVSRIHYAINLPPLRREQEDQIWKSYLDQLTPKNCAETHAIETWARKLIKKAPSGLNGREIRNLFTAAQTLAMGDSEGDGKIRLVHIERIYETMTSFRKDMDRLLIEAKSDAARS